MSSAYDAIKRGMQKAAEGRSRRVARASSTPASLNKLIRIFNREYKDEGYGDPLPLAKKTLGMFSGFIKLGRSNDWTDEKFVDTVKSVVSNWQELRKKDITSLNGKRMMLSDRPSLLEFLIGRDSVLSALHEIENRPEVEYAMDLHTHTGSVVEDPILQKSEEESDEYERQMQREYEKMMDRLME